MDELNDLEVELINNGVVLNEVEQEKRILEAEGIWQNLHLKESMLKQKSSLRWLQEGDLNTKFFHASLKAKYCRNALVSLQTDNGMVDGVCDIKDFIKDHFLNRFKAAVGGRPNLNNLEFKSLSLEDREGLEEQFSDEEIREVIF